jgi:hypothetical protein
LPGKSPRSGPGRRADADGVQSDRPRVAGVVAGCARVRPHARLRCHIHVIRRLDQISGRRSMFVRPDCERRDQRRRQNGGEGAAEAWSRTTPSIRDTSLERRFSTASKRRVGRTCYADLKQR